MVHPVGEGEANFLWGEKEENYLEIKALKRDSRVFFSLEKRSFFRLGCKKH